MTTIYELTKDTIPEYEFDYRRIRPAGLTKEGTIPEFALQARNRMTRNTKYLNFVRAARANMNQKTRKDGQG